MKEIKVSAWAKEMAQQEAQIIYRDLNPPDKPPYLDPGTELIDFEAEMMPQELPERSWGGRPNVPRADLINAVNRDVGTHGYAFHVSDSSYTGYSIWDVHKFITRYDTTDLITYISEVFDCDDFAQVLQGNVNRVLKGVPFGTIWYTGPNFYHAVNIGYCHVQKMIYLVEPQNDVFFRFNKGEWHAKMIII